MKKMVKIFYVSIILIMCFVFCGCTDIVRDSNMAVVNNNSEGLVAFSAGCSGDRFLDLYYELTDFNIVRLLSENYYNTQVIVTCKESPKYFLLKLPVGKYVVAIGTDNIYIAENVKPIFFDVQPGKVTYIGRFYVNVSRSGVSFLDSFWSGKTGVYYNFQLINNSKQDIPYFLQKYKNISEDKYDVMMASMKTSS